ncbi:MAG: hypothetical protein ISS25_02895 [Nanoarchaeota archaeon]|nr:hypothetical protein [DPANN group archaeon]MBL7116748.1 hypothetical protein [Nanoarchaeota archaeon]
MSEKNPGEKDEISLKVFPAPTEEEIDSYIDKKQRMWEMIGFAAGALIFLVILIFSLVAFFMVKNYSLYNVGIILVLLTIIIFFAWKFITMLDTGLVYFKAKVTEVSDVTHI